MPLPDFIIIGAMKSGTTTLYTNLQFHPKIGMSKLKELHFFSRHYDRPVSWYSDQFTNEKPLNGDTTPGYSWAHIFPKVAERIHETVPDVKLIYIIRDPIDRIISHLHHDLYRDRFSPKKVDEAVLKDQQYVRTSQYYYQISHYLEYFDKKQILFVETNDLKADLNGTLNKICEFLGVEEINFEEKAKAGNPNPSTNKYLIKNYDAAHKYLPRFGAKLYHLLFYAIKIKIDRPQLKEETLRALKKELYPDVEELKKLTGRDFSAWKTYNKIQL